MGMTLTQKKIKKQLDNGTPINTDMIEELIADHAHIKFRTFNLYERYKASKSAVPIFNREFNGDANKINSKLNNDFFSEIIDVKQGYMIGKPIVYQLDRNKYGEDDVKPTSDYKRHFDIISRLSISNNFVDLDAELVKLVSICGHAGREIFVDKNEEIRIVNLKAWETIFLTNTQGQVEYALRYYDEQDSTGESTRYVEFFSDVSITYFTQHDSKFEKNEELLHLFGQCPIVKVVNNEEEIGDCEKVLSLIDAYDRTLSDVNSEIEQFRLSYMYFKGKEPTPEIINNAKQTGGFYVGEDGEVGFITKNINDKVVEHHLDRLEDNILRFANSVSFDDDAFAGKLSGVAMKYKLFALETKSIVLETKIQTALRNQFKIIANLLNLQNITLDYLDLFFEFKRNIPVNEQDIIQANSMLVGLVSESTRLAQLPFIDDVDYELEHMRDDATWKLPKQTNGNGTHNSNARNNVVDTTNEDVMTNL